jgi:SAM-dependent methyltransferase
LSHGGRPAVDWGAWLDRWDAQQTGYIPDREARFAAMFDVLDVLLPADFQALDLGCGPGSLARRLLDRFPNARCLAVDLDPVLLAMGRAVHGSRGGCLEWIDADLRDPDWLWRLGTDRIDAVLSTTALHWLSSDALARLYRDLGKLVREGGVFLNGDTIRFGPAIPTLRSLGATLEQRTLERTHGHGLGSLVGRARSGARPRRPVRRAASSLRLAESRARQTVFGTIERWCHEPDHRIPRGGAPERWIPGGRRHLAAGGGPDPAGGAIDVAEADRSGVPS